MQFTRAPSVFESSGQSRSLLDDSVRWLACFLTEEDLLTYTGLPLRGVKKTWSPGEAVERKGARER